LERRSSLVDRVAPKIGEASSSPARKIETVLRAKGTRFAADMGARIARFEAIRKRWAFCSELKNIVVLFFSDQDVGIAREPLKG
jgi:hypothetical protein